MAEVSFLTSANTRKRASASRELDYKRIMKRNFAAVNYLSHDPQSGQFALVQYFFQVSTSTGDVFKSCDGENLKTSA